jgi:hypothetical protein
MAIAVSLVRLVVTALAYRLFPGLWLDLRLIISASLPGSTATTTIPSVYLPASSAI